LAAAPPRIAPAGGSRPFLGIDQSVSGVVSSGPVGSVKCAASPVAMHLASALVEGFAYATQTGGIDSMKRDLKLEDLKQRSELVPMKLLSVRVPVDLIDRIDDVVDLLNAGKGEVVVALLNEGLGRYEKSRASVRRRVKKNR
jgi:hypothetical protein